jgi:small subunit ribosomal protein S16
MDSRQPRDGRVLDTLGRYNPSTDPILLELDKDKSTKWLSCGAAPTDVVRRLLVHAGMMQPKVYAKSKDSGVSKKDRKVRKAEAAAAAKK